MGKTLFEYFNEKFEKNLVGSNPTAAFEKTVEEIGFDAYSDYKSYSTVRRRKRKRRH